MENFTPISGLIGGLMIGGAASLLVLLNGRIAGISGIFAEMLAPTPGDWAWRAAFVIGIIAGPPLVAALSGQPTEIAITTDWALLIAAGLLVGYGVRLGNGCTSGHGVCGLARGSGRSLAATMVFFAVAVATVFVVRHVLGG